MSLTTKTLANYLGNPASVMLADAPFRNWTFQKSFENGLVKPLFDYEFPQHGVDFVCDEDEKVTTIFLYSDESRCFEEGLLDLPFSLTRQQVAERLGPPSKSGGGTNDPILGEYGAWDRFVRPGYSIHVEYQADADRINKITLMRADVVPDACTDKGNRKPFLGCNGVIKIGEPVVFESDAEERQFGVVFEDDGRTGYFYARDYRVSEIPFVDALHIYSVKGVVDQDTPCSLRIIWSYDWSKAALLINDAPQAMFDFEGKIGYSKDAFPDPDPRTGWTRKPWSPELRSFFYNNQW